MKAFDKEDLALDLKSIDFDVNDLPTQRSLGLEWDLNLDAFVFKSDLADKPVTKRGILSTINSIFDPLGFLSPIILNGKLILRDIVASGKDWDESLSPDIENKWVKWKDGLKNLNAVQVPRCYIKGSLSQMSDIEFHIFSDASEKAIASVVYVLAKDQGRKNLAGFVMGKSKVAPSHGHTIPRLELCACLLATQLVEVVKESLNVKMSKIQFYTDSRVVLGYLNNRTRRFHNYVSNRVQRILSVSRYDQWFYVSSQNNPADCGTRGLNSFNEVDQKWISAPKRLLENCVESVKEWFPLITPEEDKEIRVQVAKSVLTEQFVKRFERFSDWGRLVKAFALLIDVVRGYKRKKIVEQNVKSGSQSTEPSQKISLKNDAESFIIRQEQSCMFADELESLRKRKPIFGKSSILCLNPYLDEHGIIRVKGRLQNSSLPLEETNPVILSRQCYIAKLLVRYFHEGLKHQGRLLTEGAVRSNGYWIVGAKRLISSAIHHCVKCRKLRGATESQLMADLPQDRLTPGPPFTFVGLDAFGPWQVLTRKTRGGVANSKRWAILFTCLTTRAIHIEVVEEMSSSSFINALRRFISLRGHVKQFRSDRGTNFIGALDSLHIDAISVEGGRMKTFLHNSGITWVFNPPHSSHMGGVWERMIGMTRRVLDGIFQENKTKSLTHEVLVTFMAEVCAIINSRPLVPVSTDPSDPVVLSPSMLLNQKTKCEPILCQSVDIKDMYKAQWKHVQVLSDIFWKKWRQFYIQDLQKRRKWYRERSDLRDGDIILLKEKDLPRSDWCVGVITNAIKSEKDGHIRKAEVRILKDGRTVTYTRPITEMVLLLSDC